MRLHGLALAATALVLGACAPVAGSSAPGEIGAAQLTTCRQAFQRWVDGAAALNSPDTEILPATVSQEGIQRRVFELCSLAEAEALNLEILVEYVPGQRQPLIEPDVRTFADVECVDEAPLLDRTRLCAEVGH